jgi:hypothetical protein
MRRMYRAVPVTALAFALCAVFAGSAAAQAPRPDLVVSGAAEPPDFVPLDGDFLATFTVDNQGRGRARQLSLARAYLSVGRVLSADDRRRRVGQRRVRALSPGRSTTRRMVVEIPPQFRTGEYFLIVCADVRNVIDETNDRANCHVSGQRISIASEDVRGRTGPPGPAGPQGPPGDARSISIPRKTLPFGLFTFQGFPGDVGDNEGSTEQFDLLEVGGVRIRALCRETTNGDAGNPGTPGENNGDDAFNGFDEDGDEAKILLYMDRPEGNFSFSGPHGQRMNVPAGFGRRTDLVDNADNDEEEEETRVAHSGGEGQHQFLATAADPERRNDNGDGDFDPVPAFKSAYRHAGGIVSTSEGVDFALNVYAGIDVLGVSTCVFGGSATRIN